MFAVLCCVMCQNVCSAAFTNNTVGEFIEQYNDCVTNRIRIPDGDPLKRNCAEIYSSIPGKIGTHFFRTYHFFNKNDMDFHVLADVDKNDIPERVAILFNRQNPMSFTAAVEIGCRACLAGLGVTDYNRAVQAFKKVNKEEGKQYLYYESTATGEMYMILIAFWNPENDFWDASRNYDVCIYISPPQKLPAGAW